MSLDRVRVCSQILEETFGETVANVGTTLINIGPLSLPQISKRVQMAKNDIRKALMILIQHQLVSFTTTKPHQVLYKAEILAILGLIRYPRHVHTGRDLGEEIGELIIEDIIQHGQTPCSQCIRRVSARLREENSSDERVEKEVKRTFEILVESHYLNRVKSHSFDHTSSEQPIPVTDKYSMPLIDVNQLISRKRIRSPEHEDEPVAKRRKSDSKEVDEHYPPLPDNDILWFINLDRFHRHYRDQAIVQAVGEKIDPTSSIIIKTIMKLPCRDGLKEQTLYSGTGPEVFLGQIIEALPHTLSIQREEVQQYLTLLVEEEFVKRAGDAGGGSYCINYKKSSERMCQAVLESVVRERFGSKPLRLFRLLLLKKHLEQKQISDTALIPNKESKEMLYSLLAENFVSLQEIPRATDYTPSRTFYLFSVNKNQVARVVLQRCYKALGNLMARRKHETSENKRLLEKYAHWERQQAVQGGGAGGVAEEETVELEEAITPSEREAAEKVKFSIEKLQQGEIQLDYTILTIEDYLGFNKQKSN